MTRVGGREFKNRQGYFLRKVKKGETVIITERGKPVARVSPISEWEALTLEEKLEELARQGHIRKGGGGRLRAIRPIPLRGKPASQIIIEDRG